MNLEKFTGASSFSSGIYIYWESFLSFVFDNKKAEKLKINHQRIEVTEQTTSLKSGETGKYKESQCTSAYLEWNLQEI